jgi:histone deacetylase 3
MQDVPPDALSIESIEEYNPDERLHQAEEDKRIEPANEFYDGEKDQDRDQDVEMNEAAS